jgi:methyl-accepting chemotaxis protein
LWKLNSSFDWSAGAILDLLTMESVHRDWITQLLRAASNRSVTRAPELAERRCPFGRWYYGEGYERFGDLGTFRALEEHHVRVHERARQLLRNQGQGQLAPEQIRSLIEARDQFLAGLHRVQEQVLGALD